MKWILGLLAIVQVVFYTLGLYFGYFWVTGDDRSESRMSFVGLLGVPASLLYRRIKDRSIKPEGESLSDRLQAVIKRNGPLGHWAKLELHGYFRSNGLSDGDTVPEYRKCAVQYLNEFGQPIRFTSAFSGINSYPLKLGVAELEDYAGADTESFSIEDDLIKELFAEKFDRPFVQMIVTRASIRAMLRAIETELNMRLSDKGRRSLNFPPSH